MLINRFPTFDPPSKLRAISKNLHGKWQRKIFPKHSNKEELNAVISHLQNGKASGLDVIPTEMISHFGINARKWLLSLFNNNTAFLSL